MRVMKNHFCAQNSSQALLESSCFPVDRNNSIPDQEKKPVGEIV